MGPESNVTGEFIGKGEDTERDTWETRPQLKTAEMEGSICKLGGDKDLQPPLGTRLEGTLPQSL